MRAVYGWLGDIHGSEADTILELRIQVVDEDSDVSDSDSFSENSTPAMQGIPRHHCCWAIWVENNSPTPTASGNGTIINGGPTDT